MNILLTGPFGNIGQAVLAELLARGHDVRCFDVPSHRNRRVAKGWRNHPIHIQWGDLRQPEDVRRAVVGRDAIIHLAFVIPKLSATGKESEAEPEFARAVNVDGSRHLIEAVQQLAPEAKFLFTSSVHVYGPTQHLPPPRRVTDPVNPVEHYARHKVEVEKMVRASGLTWAIFRLAASMPIRMIFDPGMFDVPLDNRIEYIHRRDVALAVANALEREAAWNRLWLIGGGPRNQYIYRDMAAKILDAMGVGMLPAQAFTTAPFAVDWMDTEESQRVLQFQTHTLDDYVAELRRNLGWRRAWVAIFRPLVRAWLLRQSPYYHQPVHELRPSSG
ncbi:MAG TPA: NAD(P)-dependent oxidoreductase [Anaerolineae bacterium]|nr:NAD(P)-dependent oxidoreductase [Anaerolineae bacterium]